MKHKILNLASILQDSFVNGPNNRDVLWVQGCAIQCPGCFNEHLWSFEARYLIPVEGLLEKFKQRVGKIQGISMLGGEPMHQAFALGYFLKGIQALGLTTVVYTGFRYEQLKKQENEAIQRVLRYTDILIDGPFVEKLKDSNLIWRGSTNQRILFLSNAYALSDVPKAEQYCHAEIHIFDSEQINVTQTGIR